MCANFVFYAFWNWRFYFLILLSALSNYAFGMLVGASREYVRRKIFLVVSVVWNLLFLGFFKYYTFFAEQMNALILHFAGAGGTETFLFPTLAIVMPLGVSFYTFKAMSYVFDIYLCKIPASKRLSDVLLYISFFPQVSSGPIVHAVDFLPSLPGNLEAGIAPDSRPIQFDRACVLIASGLLKKLVFSNFLSTLVVTPVFSDLSAVCCVDSLFAALAYTVVIYCDFSGYSDLAVAAALLLGFETPENFHRPYASFSVTEFWKRWHISFSSWLRDYLYFSMGGSRFGLRRTLAALFFTMILGGLWHGAAWTFLLWGAMHGAALACERLCKHDSAPSGKPAGVVFQTILTFLFIVVSWIVFRASSLEEVGGWFASLVRFGEPVRFISPLTAVLVVAGIFMHFIPAAVRAFCFRLWRYTPAVAKVALLAVFFACLNVLGMSAVAPFIYFQF